MPGSRIKSVMTHLAAMLVGAAIAVAVSYWLVRRERLLSSEAASGVAFETYKAGFDDQAIFLLGEAAAEDRRYYEPWKLAGDICAHRGDDRIALAMYKKALEILDREGDPALPQEQETTRRLILGRIDAMEKEISQRSKAPQPTNASSPKPASRGERVLPSAHRTPMP